MSGLDTLRGVASRVIWRESIGEGRSAISRLDFPMFDRFLGRVCDEVERNTEDAGTFAELTTEVLAEVRSQLAGLHRSVEALEAENLSLRAELDRLRIKVQGPRLVD